MSVEKVKEIKAPFAARIRAGYVLQIGDETIKGPETVGLGEKHVRAYLHMLENYDEALAYLGEPPTPKRPSMSEEVERRLQLASGAGAVAVNEATVRQIAEQVAASLAPALGAAIAVGMKDALAQAGAPARPKADAEAEANGEGVPRRGARG